MSWQNAEFQLLNYMPVFGAATHETGYLELSLTFLSTVFNNLSWILAVFGIYLESKNGFLLMFCSTLANCLSVVFFRAIFSERFLSFLTIFLIVQVIYESTIVSMSQYYRHYPIYVLCYAMLRCTVLY